ncbi:cutinase family protein [Auraticoccus sp. F435]|uniref:Cutinase family protein n=1 Tax=Auraticoccus cholistanensis TaxID=2656650 RepID=A0A6A9USC0_9ACTN|nr:cutinase family protein [Auraticoccus cholistanensis]
MAAPQHRARTVLASAFALALLALPSTATAEVPLLRWRETGPQPSSVLDAPCADLLFVGARGSGEATPYGDTVTRVRDALDGAAPPAGGRTLDVREVWLDFPAVDPHTLSSVGLDRLLLEEEVPPTGYFQSVGIGVQQLGQVLDDSAARCPGERWLLAGFSQGAQVVTTTMSRRDDDWRLAGAVLVGDPTLHPGQAVRREGSAPETSTGLVATMSYARAAVAEARGKPDDPRGVQAMVRSVFEIGAGEPDPTRMAAAAAADDLALTGNGVTFSVCDAGDLVCDAGPGLIRVATGQNDLAQEFERTRPVHGGYRASDLDPVAQAVVAGLPGRLPPPEPVPPAPVLVRADAVWFVVAGSSALLAGAGAGVLWWWRRRSRREERVGPPGSGVGLQGEVAAAGLGHPDGGDERDGHDRGHVHDHADPAGEQLHQQPRDEGRDAAAEHRGELASQGHAGVAVARAGQLGEGRRLRPHGAVRGEDEAQHDHQHDQRRSAGVQHPEGGRG